MITRLYIDFTFRGFRNARKSAHKFRSRLAASRVANPPPPPAAEHSFSAGVVRLSGSLPHDLGDLSQLSHWDTFGNKLEGDMPSSIERIGAIVRGA